MYYVDLLLLDFVKNKLDNFVTICCVLDCVGHMDWVIIFCTVFVECWLYGLWSFVNNLR